MKKSKFIFGLATVVMLCIANSLFAQNNAQQYAQLVYMGKKCNNLDQNFFIGYQAIYDANIANLCPPKKKKERSEWDKINRNIVNYLKNPNVTIIYKEDGTFSFAGIEPPYSGTINKTINKQERKDNEKAASLYAVVLKTTINEWYKKYGCK
ncbi:MAG: hypothetical protein LBH22_06430 [Bacteroidales bacterium]|jgi:hypothetical protein|nr:hypothetical protein [Bacteroidales bacterium]